jgi:outer membrane protein assembly factor BamB
MSRWSFASRIVLFSMITVMFAFALAEIGPAAEANWPRWRGPNQDGHSAETNLPVKWSAVNILWKADLPGSGQSSPIIWGDRIFLTSYENKGAERLVFCVDRKSGNILWSHLAWKGTPEKSHEMNGWASATCVTDGEVVVAFFGRGGIHAYTVDGKPLWTRDLGLFEGPWGVAACPILVDDLVVQNCDADASAHLIALDKRTGNEVWKTKRREHRGWSTPILVNAGARRELVLNGDEGVQGYDPATGRDLWFCRGFAGRGEPTVTPAGDLLCVVNGKAGDFYSVRPGGDGDVTDTHMAWHTPRNGGRDCPSPIVIGKYVIVSDMGGIATCYDATTGDIYWKQRVPGKYSGSPIAANGLAYFLNEDGKTVVIEPGESLKIVAENDLPPGKDEIFRASLTPLDDNFYIRSTTVLYCIGSK